jgi:D-tyrosyl-tRNA(Tyr) deacylase
VARARSTPGGDIGAGLVVLLGVADGDTEADFSKAARPEVAELLYERFYEALRSLGVPVRTGVFGARMAVELVNDGPVTIILDVEGSS